MARPTARVLALLELLQSGGTRTVAELASRLEVDERTVRRYVEHLLDLDVPVETVRGRYGGYRLGAGYRMPPLMLTDDEALAVVLGLVAGQRTGLLPRTGTASETAAAKIRRMLPARLVDRLNAVLETLVFTSTPVGTPAPATDVLLTLADAVQHQRPVALRYTDRSGRRSDRSFHPYGLVSHSGRWYVTGLDPSLDDERTLRLDRIADARTLPGGFVRPEGMDPAERVLASLAGAEHQHEVRLLIDATVEHVRTKLPASVAVVHEVAGGLQVDLRVASLDWLPGVLASLDRPFLVERPAELRERLLALAERLTQSATAQTSPGIHEAWFPCGVLRPS